MSEERPEGYAEGTCEETVTSTCEETTCCTTSEEEES